jgi:hypothetical protein
MILEIEYDNGDSTLTSATHVTLRDDGSLIYEDKDGNEQQIDDTGTNVYMSTDSGVKAYVVLTDTGAPLHRMVFKQDDE